MNDTFVNTILKDNYISYYELCDRAEVFLKDPFPPASGSQAYVYGDRSNDILATISQAIRELIMMKVTIKRSMTFREKDIRGMEDELNRNDIRLDNEYIDYDTESEYINNLISSLNSLAWTLKNAMTFYLAVFNSHAG